MTELIENSHVLVVHLQVGRDKGAVKGLLADWLVADDVVASSAQTMEDTLRYLDSRYGGACLSPRGLDCT